ncbi:DUF6445 family protein [Massilia sp. CF038]|uniref:DUF6445 family protein n=1 Tax=Massilia sp. CF038 TaxID=1881045 RepID=UPI000914FD37|nr:DUF6445 family protein [Massilia sp. CF038]SHG65846.1 hypothetical protein SAMN05428948_1485 [Massilia sp. CF038]
MFNPRPTIRYVPIIPGQACAVVDDFLLDPHNLREWAAAERSRFAIDPDNYYPGPELDLGPAFAGALETFFSLHVRRALGGRRTLHTSARLAMATLPAAQLSPLQRLCHRDAVTMPDNEGVAASVAYLFEAPDMGGTSFYAPTRSAQETAHYLQRAADGSEPVDAAYLSKSTPWFEQVCTVPAKFNRAIFYDGTLFHAAQISRPDLLTADPATGRLTVNGFFRYRKTAS